MYRRPARKHRCSTALSSACISCERMLARGLPSLGAGRGRDSLLPFGEGEVRRALLSLLTTSRRCVGMTHFTPAAWVVRLLRPWRTSQPMDPWGALWLLWPNATFTDPAGTAAPLMTMSSAATSCTTPSFIHLPCETHHTCTGSPFAYTAWPAPIVFGRDWDGKWSHSSMPRTFPSMASLNSRAALSAAATTASIARPAPTSGDARCWPARP
mmetsp:Transcript_108685/g.307374  ORF Transcript_108685/g.307374 Transcript_108685/m.307374 type:complete len:212 (+) Transcript_108685:2201-2836(+)